MTGIPQISVVVATLNRCEYLRLCLEALARQTAPSEAYEVIVVDNGSMDGTANLARRFCDDHRNIRYVLEVRTGLSIARNTGVRNSAADIVAFTDDDAVPERSWIAQIASRFATLGDEVAVLGGEVRPIWESPRPAWLTGALLRPLSAGLGWGSEARLLAGDEWLVEVNIAYRKAQLLKFGGFAEQLGRVGDSLLSCEGCINLLFARAGLRTFYDPAIVVGHHIHGSRLTPTWFRRRFFWQGVSMNRVHRYVDEMSRELHMGAQPARTLTEEIVVPTSAAEWVSLFDDADQTELERRLHTLEQLGYLLESQSIISGR